VDGPFTDYESHHEFRIAGCGADDGHMVSRPLRGWLCTLLQRYTICATTTAGGIMADAGTRFNVQFDERHAMRLRALAERTHVNPGTLARSLLSMALDEADPDPSSIADLLDSIPGANRGMREIRSGEGIQLDNF
jgi:hypothetical protein